MISEKLTRELIISDLLTYHGFSPEDAKQFANDYQEDVIQSMYDAFGNEIRYRMIQFNESKSKEKE